jgi:cobalt-zinc-cadmium efflux system membrane fusion protein
VAVFSCVESIVFQLSRVLIVVWLGVAGSAWAQSVAEPASIALALTAKQQTTLGVQVAPLQAASAGSVLVTASVVTPPGKEVAVSAPYAGQVSRWLVGVGDSVKAGAALAQFTSPMLGEARRQLNEAALESKNATAAAQRDQAMFDEGIIPAVRLQLSRAKQEAAQAQLHAREAELSAAGVRFDAASGYATGTLKAPIAGVVVDTAGTVGQRVEAGTLLLKVADSSQLQLDMQLSNDKATRMQVGDDISIPSRNAKAKLLGVTRSVDAAQAARARATVTQRGSLQAGELVSVTVHAKGATQTAAANTQWWLPTRALAQWRGKAWVFVTTDQGFDAVPVTVLSSSDDTAHVQAPLNPARKVAVTGIAALRGLLQKDE